MSKPLKHFYEFDNFRVDKSERLILREGNVVPLTPRAFEVLLTLIERRGEVLSKEELLRRVWADSFVEEGNLTQNIYTLRKALGKAADGDDYIRTIPRRGYRFAVDVRESWEDGAANGWQSANGLQSPNQNDSLPQELAPAPATIVIDEGDSGSHQQAAGSLTGPQDRNSVTRLPRYRLSMAIAGLVLLMGLAVGALWWYGPWQKATRSTAPMTITSLTNTGNLQCAASSPDGKYVAYAAADKQEIHSLWLLQLSTYSTRQLLAQSAVRYFNITFSPDGEYVYYVKANSGNPMRSLYRIPVLGGGEKKLIDNLETGVSFSPDGRQVVFRRSSNERREGMLIIADAEGGNEREVTAIGFPENFNDPAWSPDGKWIACGTGRSDGGLNMYVVVVNVSDGTRREISSQRWRWIGQMSWLADVSGLMMVASETPATPYQIWRLAYPNGEARKVTNDANFYNRLSMSADSRAIVAMHRKQITSMWMVPRKDAARARQITYGAGGVRGRLSWTPDGRIVFDAEQGSATTVAMMNADGSNSRQLMGDLTGRAIIFYAAASPDGRYIAYASDIAGKRHIWRMGTDGSNPVALTNGAGEDHPAWTPDGKWVIFTRIDGARPTLWRVSVDGGEPVQITDSFTSFASVSPDGKMIACFYAEESPAGGWQMALIPVEGGKPVKIYPNRIEGATLLQWMPDGRGLSYAENLPGVSMVWIQPLDGGAPQKFVEFESDRIFGFSWSPDGEQLACVRGFWSADAVLVKDFE